MLCTQRSGPSVQTDPAFVYTCGVEMTYVGAVKLGNNPFPAFPVHWYNSRSGTEQPTLILQTAMDEASGQLTISVLAVHLDGRICNSVSTL